MARTCATDRVVGHDIPRGAPEVAGPQAGHARRRLLPARHIVVWLPAVVVLPLEFVPVAREQHIVGGQAGGGRARAQRVCQLVPRRAVSGVPPVRMCRGDLHCHGVLVPVGVEEVWQMDGGDPHGLTRQLFRIEVGQHPRPADIEGAAAAVKNRQPDICNQA